MNREQRIMLTRIIISAVMIAGLLIVNPQGVTRLVVYLALYLFIGYDILKEAAEGIVRGRVFDENFLMAIATVGAFALALYEGSGDYLEAVAVMFFYQIGEFFKAMPSERAVATFQNSWIFAPIMPMWNKTAKLSEFLPKMWLSDKPLSCNPAKKYQLTVW